MTSVAGDTNQLDFELSNGASDAVNRFTIYLSGSIRKGDDDTRDPSNFWTDKEISELAAPLQSHDVLLVNPATAGICRNDFWANFGGDLFLVANSDVVVVDARTEKGVGVGGEMMFAHSRGVPIITVVPPNTNYRRDFVQNVCGEDLYDWVHPFVYGLSNALVSTFEEAGQLISQVINGFELPKHHSIEEAMSHYRTVSRTWSAKV
jgi:hypothetical protein